MTDQYSYSALNATHELSEFGCGVDSLDRWLKETALRAQEGGAAATYVWTPPDSRQVVAYFCISPTQVVRSEVLEAKRVAGSFSIIPGYLIGKLALDRLLHHQGLGTQLLLNAMEVAARAAAIGSGRLIVVDALDEGVAGFYERRGFKSTGVGLRMIMKVATARELLGTDF